ncbi:hypothetical protein EX895_000455 [Sporisorium graminicola]|uniref:Uncharacterized protein n=1 Tax=Sporisorium graminicola TaxID=280036 RepID=A0A4U7L185_9BASI|nr:hypothetical protein EX895_000455 [Sporisorium graminicola]TKY90457.1 hypothetical protein EX895_000455 [Sporisorium graminicola]
MSLRPDSVYRVGLSNHADSREAKDAHFPPKVVQIRLTEQALQQLANAYASSDGGNTGISIDVDPKDPVLVVGNSKIALHAPLPVSDVPSSKTPSSADAGSTSTAPHELYKLSKEESTLHRIGTIAAKLSVKPTRDVSAVAQRLKQQKEEEEQRKEERRRALMQGASPHPAAPSSSRAGISKTLAGVRASSGSSSLLISPLSRSSSLNRLSTRREPNLLQSTSLSRGVSRELSPVAGANSHAAAHIKTQGVTHGAFANARRTDRAFTDSPKLTGTTPSRGSGRLPDPDHAAGISGSSRDHTKPVTTHEEEHQHTDRDQTVQTAQLSSPVAASDAVPKKTTTKLTTRQRLAKATKAGSRLLTASERRATPERRTAPLASHASPPSKLSTPTKPSPAEGSSTEAANALLQHSPPKDKTKEVAASKSMQGRKDVNFMSKEAPAATVQVVTMKKARQSHTADDAKTETSQASASFGPPRRSEVESSRIDSPTRTDRRMREHISSDHALASSSSAKQAMSRKSEEDPADAIQRKRRRTNDFIPSDSGPPRRDANQSSSSDPNTQHTDESSGRRREPSRDGSARQVEMTSPRDAQTRASMPVSASMPSFIPSSKRLHTVVEVTGREPRRYKAEAYHDRRRDRSYDEPRYDEYGAHERDKGEGRRGRAEAGDFGTSSRGLSPTSPLADASAASSVERPTRGVGPGATHWSEPWLDVRSKADWHRLAQRFTKTQEEYLVSRQRLEAENERLERELELATKEEEATAHLDEVPAEQSLLFSPHKVSVSAATRGGEADDVDTIMGDVEKETAINTSVNSRTRPDARPKPAEDDGNDSPEEGEMRSSDDDGGDYAVSGGNAADKRSPETTSSLDSLVPASRRSESPDNLAWRSSSTRAAGSDSADRPLSYADLADRVKQLNELHGSLSRMHRVLTDFKAKGAVASVR